MLPHQNAIGKTHVTVTDTAIGQPAQKRPAQNNLVGLGKALQEIRSSPIDWLYDILECGIPGYTRIKELRQAYPACPLIHSLCSQPLATRDIG